ncbi:MAG TPA: DUF4446 family protein [Solirubrobacteraceae bacterium]|nr:DUF4446 family protein [Solirubrobacteraceae bacterium]
MDQLSGTTGIVALVAGGIAIVALVVAVMLAFRLRTVRNAQRAVLGDLGARDLVTHAADITEQFRGLHDWVDDVAQKLHDRMDVAEHRLDGAIAFRALVRYDAYGEMSGRQSTSIALLDANRSGVVLSSIHHRDQARLYAKQVHNGQGEIDLSPEEAEAVRLALSGPPTQEPAAERA